MNRLYLVLILLFSFCQISAREDIFSIPIRTKWAADFHFVNDSNKMSCLYLDLNDIYQFVLSDSNYKYEFDLPTFALP